MLQSEPIAIVGVGCRLPGGVHHLDEARAVFEEGRDCVSEIPPDRWDVEEYYHPDSMEPGRTYVRHGGFVDDVDRFDAGFFGIPDSEAAHMDPQQRMLLETVWHCLEHAGQDPHRLAGSDTGMFLAMMATDYHTLKSRHGFGDITAYEAMSDTDSISAGRVAHFLGLEGPCVTLDTACSGSLVATHLARQSILTGECDAAVVAGSNAILAPDAHIAFSKLGLFSRRGQCRAFDSGADGYVRSEGCVAALLKRQSLAEADGDPILATLVSTATNHTGRSRTLTAPDGPSQERVIRKALAAADVDPARVGYVEAHGTGTPVGDPIEMDAIGRTYGAARPGGKPLYVSSAKSNVGHIEPGAGLLGMVRAALTLSKETVYPSLHVDELNPKVDLSGGAIEIPAEPVDWTRGDAPRMAAVNAFGYSGTNAHAILREAPPTRAVDDGSPGAGKNAPRSEELLVLSAKTPDGLRELAGRWADFLSRTKPGDLPRAVCTAATGRAALRHRLAVTGRSGTALANSLRQWQTGRAPATVSEGRAPVGGRSGRDGSSGRGGKDAKRGKVAFVFSGQGTQYAGMARELHDREPAFAAALDQCAAVMDGELGVPLTQVLFGDGSEDAEGAYGRDIDDTRYAQPALFAVEYALAALLRSWGVRPAAVTGHSIGEVVAACTGGLLSLEEAARYSVLRGRLMSELPRAGSMLAISAGSETVLPWLADRTDRVDIASVNGPRSVVVSGATEAVEEIAVLAEKAGAEIAWLRTSHAFHSPLIDPVLPELRAHAATFRPGAPDVPVVSGMTGAVLTGAEDAEHWAAQARRPVRFHDAVSALVASGCTTVVEVGPHPALVRHLTETFADADVTAIPTLQRDGRDTRNLLAAVGALFTSGAATDLSRVYQGPRYGRIQATPQYPFRKDRHWWNEKPRSAATADIPRQAAPPLAAAKPQAAAPEPTTRASVHEHQLTAGAPWSDHRVHGATVFPATGYLELAVRALAEGAGSAGDADGADGAEARQPRASLTDVGFTRPLVLTPGADTTARLTLTVDGQHPGARRRFAVTSGGDDAAEHEHCTGSIGPAADETPADREGQRPEALRAELPTPVPPTRLYGVLREGGLEHGFHFSTVRELWVAESDREEALGRVTPVPDKAPAESHTHRTATMLDGCLQVAAALFLKPGTDLAPGGYVPVRAERMALPGPLPEQVWAHVRRQQREVEAGFVVDLRITDDEGRLVADVEGLDMRHAGVLAGGLGDADAADGAEQTAGRSRQELLDQLAPLTEEERRTALTTWLAEEVKDTLGKASDELDLDVNTLDPSLALLEIGLDSLKVTELQRRLQHKLEFRYKAMETLDYETIEGLADFLLTRVLAEALDEQEKAAAPAPA